MFCSRRDWVALGFVIRVVGTRTRTPARPSGGSGSGPAAPSRTKLRQHFWTAEQLWTGDHGRHHGRHTPAFIHAYLFPLVGAPVR